MSDQKDAKTTTIATELHEESSSLERIILETMRTRDKEQERRNREILKDILKLIMDGQLKWDKNLETSINKYIEQIDDLVSALLNEIMHHEDFQKLEASWRGLRHLVYESETGVMLKIKVMNVTKKDLLRDLER